MAGQNGISAGAGSAAMYSGMNGSVLPSAGQYADMHLLMQNMETLSGYLQQNREDWFSVQEGLERVERMRVCSLLSLSKHSLEFQEEHSRAFSDPLQLG